MTLWGQPPPTVHFERSSNALRNCLGMKDAIRGRFYRPLKQAVSLRLDVDVVAWLKKRGKGYQTRANNILRQRMLDETKHP